MLLDNGVVGRPMSVEIRRDGLPLLEGEGWGEVWSPSGKLTHLTLSLSFQERGPAPARDHMDRPEMV
ncbi:hypothetical protein ACYQR9_19030 [Methylobacterium sp. CM6241]